VVNNATQGRDDTGSYRIPIAVQFAFSIVLIGGMLVLPETPRYFVMRDKIEQAAQALAKLRRLAPDHPAVREELSEIKANYDYEKSVSKASYLDCFRGPIAKRQWTGMGLQALQQFTGVNFIFYYGTQYFKNSGMDDSFIVQVITSCVNVGSTIPGLYAIDKWGRRPLLFWGAVGMCVSQFIVAMLGTLTTSQDSAGTTIVHNVAAQKAGIAFICIYIFFFASTWGPIAWVVTGEIFPLQTRAKSLSITTATNVRHLSRLFIDQLMTNSCSGSSTGLSHLQRLTSSIMGQAMQTSNPRSFSFGSAPVSSALPLCTFSSMKPRGLAWKRSTSCTTKSAAPGRALGGSLPSLF
jgi:sugar porter (SP) family MFS transporter